jgi:hypothetical protein
MAFGGDDWVMKLMGTEERASCSGLMFWKILINRSTHESIPSTTIPEGSMGKKEPFSLHSPRVIDIMKLYASKKPAVFPQAFC